MGARVGLISRRLRGKILPERLDKSLPALILALARQGFVFFIVLWITVRVAGYNGLLFAQPLADVLTSALAIIMLRREKL